MSPGSVRPLLKPEAMAKNHPKEQLGQTIEVPVTMSDVTLPFSALICTKNFSRDGVTNSVLAESTSTKNSVKNILILPPPSCALTKIQLIFQQNEEPYGIATQPIMTKKEESVVGSNLKSKGVSGHNNTGKVGTMNDDGHEAVEKEHDDVVVGGEGGGLLIQNQLKKEIQMSRNLEDGELIPEDDILRRGSYLTGSPPKSWDIMTEDEAVFYGVPYEREYGWM